MPVFVYQGRDGAGRPVSGEMEAIDIQAVFNLLKGRNITPSAKSIRAKGVGLKREIAIPGLSAPFSGRDLVVFTRQFSTMIDSGLPIVQALDILAKQAQKKTVKETLHTIKETVETGGSLSDGLKRTPRVFDDLYVNMVNAGESGGILDNILERLAIHLEKALKLKREIKTAMIYPSVVVAVALIVTSILLIFVIPTFKDLFEGFGAKLPWLTQQVIDVSNFFIAWWHLLLGASVVCLVAFLRALSTDRGQRTIHPLALKLPVFGDIIRKICVARFSRTLGTMISAGVPILEALQVCAKTAGNKVVETDVRRARIAITEGQTLAAPLTTSTVFPPMVVQMIAVGESTGALDKMLHKIADFYEDEVDNAVSAMKQLIEPTMIVILGALIGVLVVAMYLPIFQMGTVL
jgi:type IV pilus assembly protein PilC